MESRFLKKIRRNPRVKFRQFGPSFLLSYQGRVYEMNETGKKLWLAIDSEKWQEIPASEFLSDIVQWIQRLEAIGFIETSPS